MTERWLPVPGWEGFYEVSDQGRVRGLDRVLVRKNGTIHTEKGRMRKQAKLKRGYRNVSPAARQVTPRAHRRLTPPTIWRGQ